MEHSTSISVIGEGFQAYVKSTSGDGERLSVFDSQNPYILAHTVRAKLLQEAAKADQNLRRLVCHANLFDALYVALSNMSSEIVKSYEYAAVEKEWYEGDEGHVEDEDDSNSSSDDSDDSNSEPDEDLLLDSGRIVASAERMTNP